MTCCRPTSEELHFNWKHLVNHSQNVFDLSPASYSSLKSFCSCPKSKKGQPATEEDCAQAQQTLTRCTRKLQDTEIRELQSFTVKVRETRQKGGDKGNSSSNGTV